MTATSEGSVAMRWLATVLFALFFCACHGSHHTGSLDADVVSLLRRMAIHEGETYQSFYLAQALRQEFHGSRAEPEDPGYRLGFSIHESKQSSLLTSGGVPSFHVLVWNVTYHIIDTENGELVFQGSYQQQATIDDPLQPLMMVTSMDHLRRQLGTVVASLIRARVVLHFHDQINRRLQPAVAEKTRGLDKASEGRGDG